VRPESGEGSFRADAASNVRTAASELIDHVGGRLLISHGVIAVVLGAGLALRKKRLSTAGKSGDAERQGENGYTCPRS